VHFPPCFPCFPLRFSLPLFPMKAFDNPASPRGLAFPPKVSSVPFTSIFPFELSPLGFFFPCCKNEGNQTYASFVGRFFSESFDCVSFFPMKFSPLSTFLNPLIFFSKFVQIAPSWDFPFFEKQTPPLLFFSSTISFP